jgi:two-component SAPR family response regulator
MVKISQNQLGPYERALLSLEMGRCFLESGRIEAARESLMNASTIFQQGEYPIEQKISELWLIAVLAQKDLDDATTKLDEILLGEKDWQTPTPFMLNAGHVLHWLKNIQEYSNSNPVIERFLEGAEQIKREMSALKAVIRQTSQHVSLSPPELVIETFGDVKVFCNNNLLQISDWQTREARDLFFFLLHSPPMTKEKIALEMWPDISPARLKMRFKINIHRIRRAIGQEAVIFDGERYRFNRRISYRWDREKFDELMKAAQLDIPLNEKKPLLEKAVRIADEPYLSGIDADWVLAEQLKYQDICQRMLLELGEIYLAEGQFQACLHTARQILRADALLEAAHRLIIRAYAAQHDPAGLARHYQEYQRNLADEMGLQPSSEIITLYEQLLSEI